MAIRRVVKMLQRLHREEPDAPVYGVHLDVKKYFPSTPHRELKEMCRKHGWHFIDNDSIASKYADLYVSDGIHLEAGFYEHWGRNMLMVQAGVHTVEGGTGVDR